MSAPLMRMHSKLKKNQLRLLHRKTFFSLRCIFRFKLSAIWTEIKHVITKCTTANREVICNNNLIERHEVQLPLQ